VAPKVRRDHLAQQVPPGHKANEAKMASKVKRDRKGRPVKPAPPAPKDNLVLRVMPELLVIRDLLASQVRPARPARKGR
jgi:hypothetical protein